MNKKKYCFFIISCKKNIKLLDFQLSILKKSFIEPTEIFVSFDDFVEYENNGVTIICGNKKERFGERVGNAVKMIPYDCIIVMCDDFIVEEKIEEHELNMLAESFFENPEISSVALTRISGKNTDEYLPLDICRNKYIKRSKFSSFKATLQCAMWNKYCLINLMGNVKTPWEFELYQNFRTYASINSFYSIANDLKQPITYNRGCFIIRGKMVEPERKRLENVLKIKIDKLGYETTDSYKQIDDIGIGKKIFRRILLICGDLLFRFISLIKKVNLNKKENLI
ncbi:hypothetical protein ACSW96_12110 [Clostridium perfringens]|uniref:hypothetical protein n=2 Tax=Clostridium perfringens TaxID=1502 RepID=UPI002914CE70|nr:hypothetical protein [Clostridium perfringens]